MGRLGLQHGPRGQRSQCNYTAVSRGAQTPRASRLVPLRLAPDPKSSPQGPMMPSCALHPWSAGAAHHRLRPGKRVAGVPNAPAGSPEVPHRTLATAWVAVPTSRGNNPRAAYATGARHNTRKCQYPRLPVEAAKPPGWPAAHSSDGHAARVPSPCAGRTTPDGTSPAGAVTFGQAFSVVVIPERRKHLGQPTADPPHGVPDTVVRAAPVRVRLYPVVLSTRRRAHPRPPQEIGPPGNARSPVPSRHRSHQPDHEADKPHHSATAGPPAPLYGHNDLDHDRPERLRFRHEPLSYPYQVKRRLDDDTGPYRVMHIHLTGNSGGRTRRPAEPAPGPYPPCTSS